MSELQFDRAEFDQPGTRGPCAGCATPIDGVYYGINGKSVCARCRDHVLAARTSGSSGRRFLAASGWGLGAALLGAAIYYAVHAAGYELGIISIAVGFLVGMGVRRGAQHRGGAGYQALAMGLTYLSIALSYAPAIVDQISSALHAHGEPSGVAVALSIVIGIGFTLAAPVLIGMKSILSLIISGIALYEAWKLNKRPPFVITGPHTVVAPAPAPAPSTEGGTVGS